MKVFGFIRRKRSLVSSLCLLGFFIPAVVVQSAEPSRSPARKTNLHTANQLVEHVLTREAAGKSNGRDAMLEMAVRIAPDFAPARWHGGYVQEGGKWLSVGEAQRLAAADPRFAEYERLRDEYAGNPLGELNLARWCHRKGLKSQASFHWYRVLTLDPTHQEAQRAFGVRFYRGSLLTYDEIERRREVEKQQQRVVKRLRAKMHKWLRQIKKGTPEEHRAALVAIRQLTNPLAIPLMESEFSGRHEEANRAFLGALGQMGDARATLSLARYAVFSPFAEVRSAASGQLAKRPLHEFVPILVDQLKQPVDSWFGIVMRGNGDVQYTHEVYEEGPEGKYVTQYSNSVRQTDLRMGPAKTVVTDTYTGEVFDRYQAIDASEVGRDGREKRQTAYGNASLFQAQARSREQQLNVLNIARKEKNKRIVLVLSKTTGQKLGDDPPSWWSWWNDYNELEPYEKEKPTYERKYVENRTKVLRFSLLGRRVLASPAARRSGRGRGTSRSSRFKLATGSWPRVPTRANWVFGPC